MQHNLTYIPYYQPLSSPTVSFQSSQTAGSHQIGFSKPLGTLSGQTGTNQTLITSTGQQYPTTSGITLSNITPYPSNAFVHQKPQTIIQSQTGTNYFKSPLLSTTATTNTNATNQNGNLANSSVLNNFSIDFSQQNNQTNSGQNQMYNSRNTRSPTKGTGPLPTLRSSSSKRSNEIPNDKQFEIRQLFNKSFQNPTINTSNLDNYNNKNSNIAALVNSYQFPTSSNINSNSSFPFSLNKTNSNQAQGIQVIHKNGLFEIQCDSLHQQSAEVLNKLKSKELTLLNVKQLISEVKELESKYSTLYSQLCSQYEAQLLGKDFTEISKSIVPTVIDPILNSKPSSQIEIKQTPTITITPLDNENKILKISKIPENLKLTDNYETKITVPHTTTASQASKEDKKIPIINSGNDITIILNEIKGDSNIQTFGNNEKIFKTETDDDPTDQYSKEQIKQRFLAINDDNPPQLLSIPGEVKKKPANSPKKLSFDVTNLSNDYQSSDEIERLIQQYRQNGMSKSVNHETQQNNQQQQEGSSKPNTRGNSISYQKQDSSEVLENEPVKAASVNTQQQGKRKLSDIQETSKDNTARKNNEIDSAQKDTPSIRQQQTLNVGNQSPGSSKNSKKNTTQELMDRVNNVLQRSDLFLMKHSDKKLKKGQSKNFTNATADEVTILQQQLNQQNQEYDQSSEIKAIMDQIKRKQDQTTEQTNSDNKGNDIKQNLAIKFSESSPANNQDQITKNKDGRSTSDSSDSKNQQALLNKTNIQNLSDAVKRSAENTPQSNQAVYGSGSNSTSNQVGSPSSAHSFQPISHEPYAAKSTFSKMISNTSNIQQFGSFAYSSPKSTLGLDILQNKGSTSMNNSPKEFKSTNLQNDKSDEIIGDIPSQQISNLNSVAPSVLQSPQIPHSITSYASPNVNLNESIQSIKKSEKAESVSNSQKNSQIQYRLSGSQSPILEQSDIDKALAGSPKSFIANNNTLSQITPQTQNLQLQIQSNQTSEAKQDNLNSFARNIGQSGVFSPTSFSSNKSVTVQVLANQTETPRNGDQPTINPFLKETVSQEHTENQLQPIHIKQLQSSLSMHTPLYEEIDPFSYSISNFVVGKKLGHGKFADVYDALDKHTGFRVALKQIKKDTIKEFNLYQDILNEIKVQSILNHPNIIKLYGFFIDNDSIYLIQELALGKELFNELKSTVYKKFTENMASFYVRQVIEGLIYMHSKNVVHRDLKPENIMVYNGLLKLCDFGYAAIVEKNKMRSTFCGTLDYVSPEMVQGKAYDFSVDVWSVGILTYELIIGYAPFAAKSHDATFDKIVNGELRFSGPISFEAGDFVSRILEREPNSRMNLTQALQHPFIQNEYVRRLQSEKGGEIDFSDFNKL